MHIFGAPCSYAPMEGPVHKKASRTEEGYFVGVQHPMVLILRKEDLKLISCSRKNFLVYEEVYTLPLSLTSSQLERHLNPALKDQDEASNHAVQNEEGLRAAASKDKLSHVQSIKSVSVHNIPPPKTTATKYFRAPTA